MSGSFGLPGVISSIVRPGVVINLRDGKGVFLGGDTRAEGLKAFRDTEESYRARFPGRKHYRPAGQGGVRLLHYGQQQPGAKGATGAQGGEVTPPVTLMEVRPKT